jgi:DNA-binding response OmpR family regulator
MGPSNGLHSARCSLKPVNAGKSSADARRILVVDDNLDYVQTMALMLRAMGHTVDFAINATAVLPVAQRFRPDVVILDVGLPDGDGRVLARKLRREAGLETARIWIVTGSPYAERGASLAAGCDEHFVKPLDPAMVYRMLAS